MLTDTHCHLNDERFAADLDEIIKNFKNDNIKLVVCNSADLASSKKTVEICNKYPAVYGAIGVHPHNAKDYDEQTEKFLRANAGNKKIVAIGEIGLDYYYNLSDRQTQKEVLIKQLKIADEMGLPVVFHVRDAMGEFLEILKQNKQYLRQGGVVHSFSGSAESAQEAISLGLFLGFNGIITFKNARKAVEVIGQTDLKHIVLETDAPFLTPEPFRGRRNEPKYVKYVAEKIAEIKNMPIEEAERVTAENAERLFNKIINKR